jgi:hypothetical protein
MHNRPCVSQGVGGAIAAATHERDWRGLHPAPADAGERRFGQTWGAALRSPNIRPAARKPPSTLSVWPWT